MKVDLNANEVVISAADTKHFTKEQKVNGKLILTNQRVFFEPGHPNGIQRIAINPGELREVLTFKTGIFEPSGLTAITRKGEELKFAVKNRDKWIKALNQFC